MSRPPWIALALVSLALAACGGGGGGGGSGGQAGVSFSGQVQPLFNAQCTVCHAAGASAPFLVLTAGASYGNLVNVASTHTTGGTTRVVPGSSATSVLHMRVSGSGLDASEGTMPPGFFLPAGDRALVQQWIDEGALNN